MKTDIITATSLPIDNPTAQITSHEGFPSKIHAMVSGKKFGMDINMNLILDFFESECLEVVDYWGGDGYVEYTHELFPNHRFIANASFEREGQDWELCEIYDNSLEIEVIS
jgi:hypothetical protein